MKFIRNNEQELYNKYLNKIRELIFEKKMKIKDIYAQFPVLDYPIIESILKEII